MSRLTKSSRHFKSLLSNYRKCHIIKILETFENEHTEIGKNVPLDMHIRKYFIANKEVSNIDREFINDQVYSLIRYKGLLDVVAPKPLNWHTRMDSFYDDNFEKQKNNVNFPNHVKVSFQKEMYELIENNFGEDKALDICKAMNERAPLTVRANIIKISREDLYNIFKRKNFEVKRTKFSPYGITFTQNPKCNFFAMEEFRKGYFEVQDEASQLVSLRIRCKPGDLIFDYCGGSAGKTLAIAPFTQGKGQIFIHDIRKHILLEAKRRLRRAGVVNYQLHHDKEQLRKTLKEKCDWILLDVPCTGSGTMRRNPDIKWKFSYEKLQELVKVQEKIFEESLYYLKPSGKIVYVTCSLLQEENTDQIYKFCKKYGMKIEDDVIFQTLTKSKEMDSFFSVTLRKL